MMSENLKKAYDILRRVTPLGFYDCGRLCDGLCCRGDCKGMWLYPEEAELFENKEGFELCETEGNYGYPIVICSGECDRNERPLACRIFPLFPIVTEEEGKVRINVIRDPRATMCPIIRSRKSVTPEFTRNVRLAARYLIRDEKTLEYMKAVSIELLEIIELNAKLNGGF